MKLCGLADSLKAKLKSFKQKMQRKQELLKKTDLTFFEQKELRKLKKLRQSKVLFGGKQNFKNRSHQHISSEEFKQKRLSPVYSIGEASNPGVKGNRKFFIVSENEVVFKPFRKEKIVLKLHCSSNKWKKYLKVLMMHQEARDLSITYRLDTKYIWISFDESILREKPFTAIKDRILAIDMNPNYIGWSIVDWKDSEKFNVIDKGVLSLKELNDREASLKKLKIPSTDDRRVYINDKRRFETLECAKFLIEKMKHYRCSLFSIEDLSIESKNLDKGKDNNRLCNNNWCRNILESCLSKWCSIYGVQFIKVNPAYSSFVGNLVFGSREVPDMIAASIEISRRGFELYHQWILKDKDKEKNIIFLKLTDQVKKSICQSLEELSIGSLEWRFST